MARDLASSSAAWWSCPWPLLLLAFPSLSVSIAAADFGIWPLGCLGCGCQCQESSFLATPIGSHTPSTPPRLGDHAKMPRMPLRPEDVQASARPRRAAQELREQESEHTQMQNQNQDLDQDQTHAHAHDRFSIISAISIPSTVLLALLICQVFDTSALLRAVELFSGQYCMNATTFYCGLIEWVLGHDAYLIMLILQSTATFSAFAWCVSLSTSWVSSHL